MRNMAPAVEESLSAKAKCKNDLSLSQLVVDGVPKYGWRVRLDKIFPEHWKPFDVPRLHELVALFWLMIRYFCWWIRLKLAGKTPFIDQILPLKCQQIYGVPLGGLGCGTIGRGWRGEFCRYQLIPGMYEHKTVRANQFIVTIRRRGRTVYQQVLSPHRSSKSSLKSWRWGFNPKKAFYHALYPRSWSVYDIEEYNVRLICKQISPIIPHNYKDSCLPVAVFVWEVENTSDEPYEISITFTFKNGMGVPADREGGCFTESFLTDNLESGVGGVKIHQQFKGMPCVYGIAAAAKKGVDISHKLSWNPRGDGADIWMELYQSGCLSGECGRSHVTKRGQEIACAISSRVTAYPGTPASLQMCCVWDMPRIQFGAKRQFYYRRYTRWFGRNGNAAPALCAYALNNYRKWDKAINAWIKPILTDTCLPSWYKSALFNELYFISDGGTIWVDVAQEKGFCPALNNNSQLTHEYGKFAYLEGQEYRMYNTYDVHYYASFALAMLWPKLELSLLYDFASVIQYEDKEPIKYMFEGQTDFRKEQNSVPHDMGDPDDEPWERINAYIIHHTGDWKDLNLKFVLQVYRDYLLENDVQLLKDMWPIILSLMDKGLEQDTDGDGIIDNRGADQTYDSWKMHGASAYCGGLWLAALKVTCTIAELLGHTDEFYRFAAVLEKASNSYQKKLWNGQYYRFDSSKRSCSNSIMSDQMAGYWYLKACGVEDNVLPEQNVRTALNTVFKFNVELFEGGTMGAVNAVKPDGKPEICCLQAEESWTGTSYAVAATMIQEGLVEQGFKTAEGVYRSCYDRLGLGFQTPEALYAKRKKFRALAYMRPLSIWAIQWAVERVVDLHKLHS